MSEKRVRSDDKASQKETANELQSQLDEILSGQAPREPRSLRDFINKKMAEDVRRKTKAAAARSAERKRKPK